jgi:hypothetical protein
MCKLADIVNYVNSEDNLRELIVGSDKQVDIVVI